jgi:hypothetical protein
MEMTRSEIMKKAWQYRKSGRTWSESLKAAWADAFLGSLDFGPQIGIGIGRGPYLPCRVA